MKADLHRLAGQLEGELHSDEAMRRLYATDASEYQEMPVAVALPKSESDAQVTLLAAPGTSCRHQFKDATGRQALHPVEILHGALR